MAKGNNAKKKKRNKNLVKEHNKVEQQFADDTSLADGVKVIIIVLVVLALFYLLTVVLINRKTFYVPNGANIQYTKILAGESFKQSEDDYLVFFYDSSASDASSYSDLVSNYREKEKHLPIYTVDLHEGMNKRYIADLENLEAANIYELKVKGATIIRFKEHVIHTSTTTSFEEFLNNNVE